MKVRIRISAVFLPVLFAISVVAVSLEKEIIPGWGEVVDPAGDCPVVARGDRLTITVPGTLTPHDLNPFWEYENVLGPRVLREVEGDFQVQVKVRPFPPPAPNTYSGKNVKVSYVGAGLLVWLDEKTFVRCLRAARGEGGGVGIHLEAFQDAKPHKVTYVSAEARRVDKSRGVYLRVERRGDDLTFSTSADGEQWTVVGRVGDLKLPGKIRAGVGVVNATTLDFAPEFEALTAAGN